MRRWAWLAAVCLSGAALGETVNLYPSRDTTIYSEDSGASNGLGQWMFAGRTGTGSTRRALVNFRVAGIIPDGAVIENVSVRLHMSRTTSGAQDVGLHRLLASWGENISDAGGNEGAGAPASPNDATWRYRFYDAIAWNTPGGDFVGAASATKSVASVEYYVFSSTQMTADVQHWLDNPDEEFGWLIKGNESSSRTAKRFDSGDNSTNDFRPILKVTYSVPEPAAALLLLVGAFALRRR
ncbi:MAG: DNRLRE domain-containing protein [Phycisphaerales bacterium]|nr:DNRLRE domain-containing protein [Phycisphaerales bacterium]